MVLVLEELGCRGRYHFKDYEADSRDWNVLNEEEDLLHFLLD